MLSKKRKEHAIRRTQAWRMRVKLMDSQDKKMAGRNNVTDTKSSATESQLENKMCEETQMSKETGESIDTDYSDEKLESRKSPFNTRLTQYRVIRKVKSSLPMTPEKRACVIEKLSQSPRVKKLLEQKGVIVSEEAKQKTEVGHVVIETLNECLSMTKKQGTLSSSKNIAMKHLSMLLLKQPLRNVPLREKLRLY